MKKIQKNALVDLAAIVFFLPMTVSGIVIDVMNRGGGYEGGRNPAYIAEILALSKPTFIDIHTWTGYAFVILILVHLALHAGFMQNIHKYASWGQKRSEESDD